MYVFKISQLLEVELIEKSNCKANLLEVNQSEKESSSSLSRMVKGCYQTNVSFEQTTSSSPRNVEFRDRHDSFLWLIHSNSVFGGNFGATRKHSQRKIETMVS